MPLPTRKAAPTPGAKTDTAAAPKGATRLPPRPQGGLKAGKKYQYLNIPRDMERCTWLVRLVMSDQKTSEKSNIEKYIAQFEVLETDVPGIKVGSEVTEMMPLQGEQALYFWKGFGSMCVALMGTDVTDDSLAEFEVDCEATYAEVVEKNSLEGCIARCSFKRGKNASGGDTFYRDWYPATEAELAKHSK